MCRVIVIAVLMDAAVIEKWGGLNGGIAEVWVHDDRGNDRTNNMPRNTKTKLGIVHN
jgi:hypothetical protein